MIRAVVAHWLERLAWRINPPSTFRHSGVTFTVEPDRGVVSHVGTGQGCPLAYRAADRYLADIEADTPTWSRDCLRQMVCHDDRCRGSRTLCGLEAGVDFAVVEDYGDRSPRVYWRQTSGPHGGTRTS